MFVVELLYKADLAEIDAHMRDHMRFVDQDPFVARGLPDTPGKKLTCASAFRVPFVPFVPRVPFVPLLKSPEVEFRVSQRADDLDARIPKASTRGRR